MYGRVKNRRMIGKKSSNCPHCGRDPKEVKSELAEQSTAQESDNSTDSSASATTSNTEGATSESNPAESYFELEESGMKQATQAVVKEAMKVLNPLLEKLDQANQQLKQQMPSAMDMSQEGLANNLEQLQKVSEERLKNQEKKVAARMQKMQNRFG